MRRSSSPSSLKYLAVAATDTAMSSRSPYRPRGGRNQWHGDLRNPTSGGRGDSHYWSREGNPCFQTLPVNPRPHFNQDHRFNHRSYSNTGWPRNPQPHFNQNQHFSPQPPSQQNQPIHEPHSYRPQAPKPSNYHEWEYGRPTPPLHFGIVSGDSHHRSVRDANMHFRQVGRDGFSNQIGLEPPPVNPAPHFNQYQSFDRRPHFNSDRPLNPTPHVNQNQPFSPRPHFQQNQSIHQPHPYRPQRPSESIHREWEYARPGPPLHCERFTVLSYNLLADYLAINHWDQLYYHIPNHMLKWEWRKRSIIFELGWWSADIMCFQEVDRFRELEDELKLSGYIGIWKMRTGDAVDGCAIFWRASRFKLLHEECIEFNKLGLRNNVAQICVLESLRQNNIETPPMSSTGSNKVVICNIHVLFNPKRGEIKLGQVRILLDKAHAVSKIWNNAPIVVCGDFNCTPKSPLYDFLSEQKLDLTDLARDKVSGQASCVIRSPKRFNTNHGVLSADTSVNPPTVINGREIGAKQSDSISDMPRQNVFGRSLGSVPFMNDLSDSQCTNILPDLLDKSCTDGKDVTESSAPFDRARKEYHQGSEIGYKNETEVITFVPFDHLKESTSNSHCEEGSPVDKISAINHKFNASVASDYKNINSDMMDTKNKEKVNAASYLDNGLSCIHSNSYLNQASGSINSDKGPLPFVDNSHSTISGVNLEHVNASNLDVSSFMSFDGNSSPGPVQVSRVCSSENPSSQLIANDEDSPLPWNQVSVPNASTDIDNVLDEPDEDMKGETNVGEDYNTLLSELHGTEDAFSSDFGQFVRSGPGERDNTEKDGTQGSHNEISPNVDFVPADVYKTSYDRSSWTPMEIETATGNANCTLLEHPLKLRSTYTEVEGLSQTRDLNGEPEVTSYNRCFLGTVDYIWRSEGLHTVRALAPIPKHAMQWTKGFPTKKWGSDHIALASELAFVKDATDENMQTR